MQKTEIKWYSLGPDQKVVEHESIDLKKALEIADQYLARGSENFKSDSEAIASTMFGFIKSKSNFVEICVNGPNQISYRLECSDTDSSWFQKLGKGIFRRTDELHSRDELVHEVTEFFSHSSKQTVQRFRSRSNRVHKSPLGNRPTTSVGVRSLSIIVVFILGLLTAFYTIHGIDEGRIWWPSKYSPAVWVHEQYSPKTFWFLVLIYVGASAWMIRASLLELKIPRKILRERKKKV